MKIQTTMNIHKNNLSLLTTASYTLEKSRSEIIIMLLKKMMNDNNLQKQNNRSVKYQASEKKVLWHKFHISLKSNDYEFFLDLRKIFKMSVSKILAYAVNKYLDSIINTTDSDNYTPINYIISKNMVDGVIFWQLFWGIPKNLEELLKYSKL